MTPRKAPTSKPKKKGLLPKLKLFWDALSDRCQFALQVIDEALASDNLKEKIWAVDWIFKRLPAPSAAELEPNGPTPEAKKAEKALKISQLQTLDEAALLARIRDYLKDGELE